jgi:hypothetical protein
MHGYRKADLRRADQASEILFTEALQFLRKVIKMYPITLDTMFVRERVMMMN